MVGMEWDGLDMGMVYGYVAGEWGKREREDTTSDLENIRLFKLDTSGL